MKITRFTKQAVELDQEIQDLLTSIRTVHSIEFCTNQRDGINGSHVWNLIYLRDNLKNINDYLTKQGEYTQ